MLNRIKLTNFRKHENLEQEFAPGFSVLRGANEAGKSTVFEAVAYAIFGVGALRTGLDETVTWGKPESSLKVELDLTIDSTMYRVTRGKSGAEITYSGGSVSGQKEVTKFLAGLMRMDINAAKRLVLSNQKEIAGALEAGTKATTEMIERLADFDQIDRLIELMEVHLALGSDAHHKARLEAVQADLERANSVVEPDFEALQEQVDGCQKVVDEFAKTIETARASAADLKAKLAASQQAAAERKRLEDRERALQSKQDLAIAERDHLRSNPVNAVPGADERVQSLMAERAGAREAERLVNIHTEVSPLLGRVKDTAYFNGSKAQFEERRKEVSTAIADHQRAVRDSTHAIALLKKDLQAGSCSFCGQDFSDLPQVKEANAGIQRKIDDEESKVAAARSALQQLEPVQEALETILSGSRKITAAAAKYSDHLLVSDSTFPPVLEWDGSAPVMARSSTDIDAEIAGIRKGQADHQAWADAVKANAAKFEAFVPEREAIETRRAELGEDDGTLAALTGAYQQAEQALRTMADQHAKHQTTLSEAKGDLRDAKRDWEAAQAGKEAAAKAVETAQEALRQLAFNNALMKRVRAARPVIADRLWNLVLTSVSSYFSEIRGVPSTVSKGPDGFQIDGKPVESFSGSTIDALGLAIRVALVRTFLPTAPFLILDEPAAACSEERTQNMLGFIMGTGFQQVLLVTHENVSEGVADHVVLVGDAA